MQMRARAAAAAGMAGAATAHLLDQTGRLPFVHEAVQVRTGMSVPQVVAWLVVVGAASALASTRLVLWGAPVAIAAGGAPELIARHDPGAVAEPGALVGAALQLPILVAVVAVVLILERRLPSLPRFRIALVRPLVAVSKSVRLPELEVRSGAVPRAPPVSSS